MDIASNWYNYLHTQRKLSPEVIHGARLTEQNGLLAIPIFDSESKVLFNKYRRAPWMDESVPKYQYDRGATVSLYGIDHLSDDIVICEGELDVLALLSVGVNACTSTGGALSFQATWIPLFDNRNVTVLMDNDETGIRGAVKLALILKRFVYRWVPRTYGKDIGDVLMHHGVDKVHEILTRSDLSLIVNLPDVDKKSALHFIMMENRKLIRIYGETSVPGTFLALLNMELLNRVEQLKKKPAPTNGVTPDITQAKAYPIENIINVTRHLALCPFHHEKTPSMHVYKDNHAYCFGCQKYADSIDIAMRVWNISFKEAVNRLSHGQ
jgi:DNA primase